MGGVKGCVCGGGGGGEGGGGRGGRLFAERPLRLLRSFVDQGSSSLEDISRLSCVVLCVFSKTFLEARVILCVSRGPTVCVVSLLGHRGVLYSHLSRLMTSESFFWVQVRLPSTQQGAPAVQLARPGTVTFSRVCHNTREEDRFRKINWSAMTEKKN